MKRSILVILLFCLLVPLAEAQLWKIKRYEAVAGIGPSLFFGDIGGFSKTKDILGLRDISFLQTRFDLNLSFKYRITQDINARFSFTTGLLHAVDSRGSNKRRGYEASTFIIEPALLGEYYFMKNRAENSYLFSKGQKGFIGGILGSLDIYAFGGFGGLIYSVTPNDSLKVKMAQKGIKSSGATVVIPLGIGATIVYSPNISFGAEIGGRYTFSDYIDGYTSQFSTSNDVYYFLNFTVTYKLRTTPNGFPSFR
jgi:hypothetical protein